MVRAGAAEKQRLEAGVLGLRAKVRGLLDARTRARASRLGGLLARQSCVLAALALRQWQMATLVGGVGAGLVRAAGLGLASASPLPSAGEAKVGIGARVISLQRELLARETDLSLLAARSAHEKAELQAQVGRERQARLAGEGEAARRVEEVGREAEQQMAKLEGDHQSQLERAHAAELRASEAEEALARSQRACRAAEEGRQAACTELQRVRALGEEVEDAFRAAEEARICAEAQVALLGEQLGDLRRAATEAVESAHKNRPLRMQRELEQLGQEKLALQRQLAQQGKKLSLQQRRVSEAEARADSLHKEASQNSSEPLVLIWCAHTSPGGVCRWRAIEGCPSEPYNGRWPWEGTRAQGL